MQGQKSHTQKPHGGGWFNRVLKPLFVFFGLIFSFNFIFINDTSALFVPTLSASVDQANLQVNGNQVINSTDKTIEIPFNFTVNTNNRTGYTATLSSETENTALTNAGSATRAKIDSISTDLTLNNLPNNTWGYKFGSSSNYAPIPALSTPVQILQTTGKTNGNESNQLSIGMKLAENLESGNYTNKLILSFVSNPYTMRAVMTNGPEFNTKLHSLETATNKIEHFRRIYNFTTSNNTVNVESYDSDYEIKIWFDTSNNTAYYYTNSEKIILNSDCQGMFMRFDKMKELDLRDFDSSLVENMHTMFYEMRELESINLSNFNTSNVHTMYAMFDADMSLEKLDVSSFQTNEVTDMKFMFFEMRKLKELNLSNFNTSKAIDMGNMFANAYVLEKLDISRFDTSNVINMEYMFAENHKLKTLNLGHLNTSRVTTMEKMFNNMWALENLDVSSFDTSNVTNMKDMFNGVTKITTLNLNNFNTSNVTDMSNMFNSMLAIENLSLPSFDTRRVITMRSMFATMEGLKNLNISSFDTSNVRDFRYMFGLGDVQNYGYDQVDHLEHIYASKKFVISAMETGGSGGIFHRRPSLTVGAGCTYVSGTGNPFCIGSTWVVLP